MNIKLRIVNFDVNTQEFKMGESKVLELPSYECIELLKKLPPISLNHPIFPMVIMEDLIFTRINSEEFSIIWNFDPVISYTIPKELRTGIHFNINTIDNNFENILDLIKEDIKKIKRKIKSEPFLLFFSSFIVVILNLILLVKIYYFISFNYRLLFIWFIIFNIIGFPYMFSNLKKKNYHKFELKAKSPIIEGIKSQKLLVLIFIVGFAIIDIYILFYLFITVPSFMNENFGLLLIYDMITGTGVIFIVSIHNFIQKFYRLSKKKEKVLDYIENLILNEENYEKKNFFNQIRLEIKNEKILKLTPKTILIVLLNVCITIILSI